MDMLSFAQNNTKRVENKDLVYTKAANHAFNFLWYLLFLRNYLFTAAWRFLVSIPDS